MHKLAARSFFLLPAALAAAFVFFAALANPVSAVGMPLSPGEGLALVDAEKDTMLVPTDWDLLPEGMEVGDTFRLLFATGGKRDAMSPIIDDYNYFVREEASIGCADARIYKDYFWAISSTDTVDARDNTSTNPNVDGAGESIYWLNGPKAADDYADFYDGSWDHTDPGRLSNGKATDFDKEEGVFTGSEGDGSAAVTPLGGSEVEGTPFATVGKPGDSQALDSNSTAALGDPNRFYGLSGVFQVADATPLPVGLFGRRHGELTVPLDRNWYSFPAVHGERYVVELTSRMIFDDNGNPHDYPNHMVDPSVMEVVDASRTQVIGEREQGGFRHNFARAFLTPSKSGTLYLAVGSGSQDRWGVGHYTISVRIDDHADDYRTDPGVVLRLDRPLTAVINHDVASDDPRLDSWAWEAWGGSGDDRMRPRRGIESLDDRDVFRFEIAESGIYKLAVTDGPPGVGIWWVWDRNGDLFAYEQNAPAESMLVDFEPGTYFVEIGTPYGSEGNTGSYTVVLTASEE